MMIPQLNKLTPTQQLYLSFLEQLTAAGFAGELSPQYAQRTVLATDNSIYQILPQAVVYPKHQDDLVVLAQLLAQPGWQSIVVSARGGGTGTNGQSLTEGLVVDCSRHMNKVLEVNAEEGWALVQAGVVKDQLNAVIKPLGLFFAPELSTSNRATIGGMISTDASGQGSVRYGKTRDHVLSLDTVLLGGDLLTSEPLDSQAFAQQLARQDRIGDIYRTCERITREHADAIRQGFPPLNRCLTGYDLNHLRADNGSINLNNLVCGSEGTLGFISQAKINLLPSPKVAALVCVRYDSFEASLRDAQNLMTCQPTSIETVDGTVLNLARQDLSWNQVADFFPEQPHETVAGINLVEYTADSQEQLEHDLAQLTAKLDPQCGQPNKALGYTLAMGSHHVAAIWGMRKKAVGLLGNAQGEARPVPFVEDTAVAPEHLADFIMEFRAILDRHQLKYGMFGHVDAGVLHVRPALDMKDPEQARLVRQITDEVVVVLQKYNGLLWGEHGKGVRSEYAPAFFGDLYPLIQQIKASFDPNNQFNPGKIATPNDSHALLRIDGVPTRGEHDRQIPVQMWQQFDSGNYCNGNGACFNWDPKDAMCPSYKISHDRVQSPKGRSSLIREWLRLLADKGVDTERASQKIRERSLITHALLAPRRWFYSLRGGYDYSHEIYASMATCLSCKSCTGSCPIRVDVPEFRARFLELHHERYARPAKDYLIAGLEFLMPLLAPVRLLYNLPMQWSPVKWLLKHGVGMVDSPLIARIRFEKEAQRQGFPLATAKRIAQIPATERHLHPVLVQDAFTSFFEPQVVLDILQGLRHLGFKPLVMPFGANGKPLHVHGFLATFARVARKQSQRLTAIADQQLPLIGVDPSLTLSYRAEYKKYVGQDSPEVMLIQEYLCQQLQQLPTQAQPLQGLNALMLGHCTEKTNAPASSQQWQQVFRHLGGQLNLEASGCCGMAGTYGHETRNLENSAKLWHLSWHQTVISAADNTPLLATGYSCRSQAKRMAGATLLHPMQLILKQYKETAQS